jgi:hypothetical protein
MMLFLPKLLALFVFPFDLTLPLLLMSGFCMALRPPRAASPCVRAFRLLCALPSSVRGPLLSCA